MNFLGFNLCDYSVIRCNNFHKYVSNEGGLIEDIRKAAIIPSNVAHAAASHWNNMNTLSNVPYSYEAISLEKCEQRNL